MDERERLNWIEHQVVRILRLIIVGISASVGAVVANLTVGDAHEAQWLWAAVFVGAWLLAGFVVERSLFRGAPEHVKLLG